MVFVVGGAGAGVAGLSVLGAKAAAPPDAAPAAAAPACSRYDKGFVDSEADAGDGNNDSKK